jgi:hypothetical protein
MNFEHTLYVPSITPHNCLHLASATYKGEIAEQQEYLNENIPQAKVLDTKNFNEWCISLIKMDDQLAVSFEGTTMSSLGNWMENIEHQLHYFFHDHVYGQTIGFFEKTVKDWKNNFKNEGRITLFTGHSAGGCFASHTLKTMKVVRVTFNSHLAKSGSFHCNLTTKHDAVSAFPAHEGEHVVVGGGMHRLKYFLPHIPPEKTWSNIYPNRTIEVYTGKKFLNLNVMNNSLKDEVALLKIELRQKNLHLSEQVFQSLLLRVQINALERLSSFDETQGVSNLYISKLDTLVGKSKRILDCYLKDGGPVAPLIRSDVEELYGNHGEGDVSTGLWIKEPERYTRALSTRWHSYPNAYLLNNLLERFLEALDAPSAKDEQDSLRKIFRDVGMPFYQISQMEWRTRSFFINYAEAQNIFLELLNQQRGGGESLCKINRVKEIKKFTELIDGKIVGSSKFFLQQLVHKQMGYGGDFSDQYLRYYNSWENEALKKGGAAGAVIGGVLGVPTGPIGFFATAAWLGGTGGLVSAVVYRRVVEKRGGFPMLESVQQYSRDLEKETRRMPKPLSVVQKIQLPTRHPIPFNNWCRAKLIYNLFFSCIEQQIKCSQRTFHVNYESRLSGRQTWKDTKILTTPANDIRQKALLDYKVEIVFEEHGVATMQVSYEPSYLTERDIRQMPQVGVYNRSYDRDMQILREDYSAWLSAPNIPELNVEFVGSLDPELIALVFPQEVVTIFTQEFSSKMKLAKLICPEAQFKVYYDLSKPEVGSKYQLTLKCYFFESENKWEYKKSIISEIDRNTIEATTKIDFSNKDYKITKPNLSESIFEKMYASVMPLLGIPKKTYRLSSDEVVVSDHDPTFDGIFNRLKENPDLVFEYDSSKENPESSRGTQVENGSDFESVELFLKLKLMEFLDGCDEFKNLKDCENKLLAVTTLLYKLDIQEIKNKLSEYGLYSSSDLAALDFEQVQEADAIHCTSDFLVSLPSEFIKQLQENFKKVSKRLSEI